MPTPGCSPPWPTRPASPGGPGGATAATVVVPWNDEASLRAVAEALPPAAIIAEPLPANMGLVAPAPGFLEALRDVADATGAVLVLDEVISGFRVGRGGAQELFGVLGDLVVMGKIIGGGLPAAAVGGRSNLVDMLAQLD